MFIGEVQILLRGQLVLGDLFSYEEKMAPANFLAECLLVPYVTSIVLMSTIILLVAN